MTFGETQAWLRENGVHINRLAELGDALAVRLIAAYRALYAKQLDPYLQTEWMKICDDFVRRDLTMTTRTILQDRFGHKEPKNLRRLDS